MTREGLTHVTWDKSLKEAREPAMKPTGQRAFYAEGMAKALSPDVGMNLLGASSRVAGTE